MEFLKSGLKTVLGAPDSPTNDQTQSCVDTVIIVNPLLFIPNRPPSSRSTVSWTESPRPPSSKTVGMRCAI